MCSKAFASREEHDREHAEIGSLFLRRAAARRKPKGLADHPFTATPCCEWCREPNEELSEDGLCSPCEEAGMGDKIDGAEHKIEDR